jgi:8-hydroxy-5-deazaflavin:NADPH oxidoreductase
MENPIKIRLHMNIGIIGSGNVGGALARQWIRAGHKIRVGAKFPLSEKNKLLATHIGESAFDTVEAVVQDSAIILLAIPPAAIVDLAPFLVNTHGKIIIDATNSVLKGPAGFPTVFQYLAANSPAELVKCFNTTGFENLLNPSYDGIGIDMFMAGDSEKAKAVAHQLALDTGFATCIDFGKSDKVELLEKLALAWINLAIWQGKGRNIAFKILRR